MSWYDVENSILHFLYHDLSFKMQNKYATLYISIIEQVGHLEL